MSELNENPVENPVETPAETPPETPGAGTEPTPATSTSKINLAVESVITLINAMKNFASMTRGALGTANGLTCEIAPSYASEVYMDKNAYLSVTLALNGKHDDLRILSDTLNNIMDTLTRSKSYPSGGGWEIVDITTLTEPQVIGREQDNRWMMASALLVKVGTFTPEGE